MTILATGWAVVRPDGTVVTCTTPGVREHDAWWVAMGYGDTIEAAQACGARAVRCEVREIGGEG